eukprot:TRINITY_DN3324_c0_g1_i1.p2 TRINITY_DN3324_c0_g1~~TRINITY_DN3324_c0_g1_i1.p2  ORF type:complete len:146 (+),score=11.46 TRINITY_DN3324_c0_g1_i1:137-574(+)
MCARMPHLLDQQPQIFDKLAAAIKKIDPFEEMRLRTSYSLARGRRRCRRPLLRRHWLRLSASDTRLRLDHPSQSGVHTDRRLRGKLLSTLDSCGHKFSAEVFERCERNFEIGVAGAFFEDRSGTDFFQAARPVASARRVVHRSWI